MYQSGRSPGKKVAECCACAKLVANISGMTDADSTPDKPGKAIQIALWTAQVIIAILFTMAGFMKLTKPIGELAAILPWAGDIPEFVVRFIGLSELCGGLGMVLPSLTRIRPRLTPLAALGLITIMGLAAIFHLTRGEAPLAAGVMVIALPVVFVAWGRTKKAPITPRT